MDKLSFRRTYGMRFTREEHLKGRSRIREVFGKGKRYYSEGAKLLVLPNNLPYNRICFSFTSGNKFGSAVARNRAKRFGREAYRLLKDRFLNGYDLILQIMPASLPGKNQNIPAINFQMMTEQLQSLFKKAGLCK